MARERELLTIVAHASAVSCAQRASERASHACVRMRQLSLARTQSSVDRGFYRADTRHSRCTARGSNTRPFCIRVFSAWDGPSRLCFHFLDAPDCGRREIAESVMGIEHTAASRPWTVQIVGGRGRGGGDCRILDGNRTRSRMWFHAISTVQIVGGRFCKILSFRSVGCLLYLHLCGQFLLCSFVLGLVGPLGISASLSSHYHPTRNGFCVPFFCLFFLKSPYTRHNGRVFLGLPNLTIVQNPLADCAKSIYPFYESTCALCKSNKPFCHGMYWV